jgi:hypothetical protein
MKLIKTLYVLGGGIFMLGAVLVGSTIDIVLGTITAIYRVWTETETEEEGEDDQRIV